MSRLHLDGFNHLHRTATAIWEDLLMYETHGRTLSPHQAKDLKNLLFDIQRKISEMEEK